MARSLSNLGLIYSNLRNYDEAALKQMEALRIRGTRLPLRFAVRGADRACAARSLLVVAECMLACDAQHARGMCHDGAPS